MFFLPVLRGSVLLPALSDLMEYYYPAFIFLSHALQTGQSFLWTPEILSGFPMYVSQVAGFFDPLNWMLNSMFTPPLSVELRIMFDMLLAMVCAYAAARSIGISRVWASLVGPSYLLAFDWLYVSNPLIANSLFILPLLIYCLTELTKHEHVRWRLVVLGGLGYGWALLSGYTQLALYAALLGGVYLVVYSLLSGRPWRQTGKRIGAYAVIGCIGLVIGLPQLLPAAKFLPYTPRGEASSYESATLKVIAPGDLVTTLVPPALYVPYVTAGRKPMFVGALMLFMALGTLCMLAGAVWRQRRELSETERHMSAVGATFLFAFIAAVQYSPLYLILSKLPLLSSFRFPFRFMFLGAFLLGLLGAYGLEHADAVRMSRLWRICMYVFGTLAALFVLGVTFVNLLSTQASTQLASSLASVFSRTLQGHLGFHKDAAAYAHAFEQGIGAYRELLSLATPGVLLPMLALSASLVAAYLYMSGKVSTYVFRRVAVAVIVFGIGATAVAGWGSFAPMSAYGGASPFMRYMPDLDRYRAYSFLVGEAASGAIPPQYKLSPQEQAAVRDLSFAGEIPNQNIYHGVPTVDGYDQFEPQTTLERMLLVGGELGGGGASAGTPQQKQAALLSHLDLLGAMGGKYIISGVSLQSPSLVLLATSSVTDYHLTLYLYENKKAFPIYFIAQAGCVSCKPVAAVVPTKASNGVYDFSLPVSAPRTLVLSQTNLPGWRVTVDGAEVLPRRVNDLYLGVDVPAGTHIVHFEYRGILGELSVLRALGIVRR